MAARGRRDARGAARRGDASPHGRAHHLRPVALPLLTRAVVVANPVAGGGRARRALALVEAALRAGGLAVRTVASRAPGDAERLAREAAADADLLVAVGGDGTLHEIVNGLLAGAARPALGIVPAGRGNDFARALGVPRRIEAAARALTSRGRRRVDVGRCGARAYLTAGGVGFDADVAARARALARRPSRGPWPYVLAVLRELPRYVARELVIECDGRALARRCAFVAVANTAWYGGGMKICPGADPADGLLDVCVVGDVGRAEIVRMLPGVFAGRHLRHPKVALRRARVVRVAGAPGTRAHVDGESAGTTPVEFTVVPGALELVVAGMPTA